MPQVKELIAEKIQDTMTLTVHRSAAAQRALKVMQPTQPTHSGHHARVPCTCTARARARTHTQSHLSLIHISEPTRRS
eukprot:431510-Prymnesium_polylepis.2